MQCVLQLLKSLLLFVLALRCIYVRGEDAAQEAAALRLELPTHDCSAPDPGQQRHVNWIKKLNGRRIVFVGDSPLRCERIKLSRRFPAVKRPVLDLNCIFGLEMMYTSLRVHFFAVATLGVHLSGTNPPTSPRACCTS
jgi:hypothetical protein